MLKIDLHTHSTQSPDGGISEAQYEQVLELKKIDVIAITDHDSIQLALKLNTKFGHQVIVGEEIMTNQGEIIGLFLTKKVEPGMDLADTIKAIKDQGGIVYLPHPFEKVRKGISMANLEEVTEHIDIVEVYNARAVRQGKGIEATKWARMNSKATAASSDAHGVKGLGSAYSMVKEKPTRDNLVKLMKTSKLEMHRPPLQTLLYPKLNRLRGRK